MEVMNCDKGMIFLCEDKCSKMNPLIKHDYLIISVNEDTKSSLGYIQAMGITSMSNKDVYMEVPIVMCNDYVSYVVPYNLHSFTASDIRRNNYRGCILNSPIISKNDFINLLMDIYLDSLGLVDHEKTVELYNRYCTKFWSYYKGVQEYRDIKTTSTSKEEEHDSDKIEDMSVIIGSSNTREKIEISTREQKSFRQNNKIKDELKFLESSKRFIRDWPDEDITKFLKYYKKYGFDVIHNIIPDRWVNPSSMSVFANKCKEELRSRKKKSNPTDSSVTKINSTDPLKRPMSKWSDKELLQYLELVERNKSNGEFLMEYTGFTTLKQCYTLNYKVRQEIKARNLQPYQVSV